MAKAAFQGLEQRAAAGFGAVGEHAAGEAAVTIGEIGETWKHALNAEVARIAAVDAGEQGFGEVVDGLGAVVILDEFGDGAIGLFGSGTAKEFEAHADLGAPTEQWRERHRHDFCGNHHHEAVGHLDHAAVFADEGLA